MKSPGNDGFPTEFYKFVRLDVKKSPLMKVIPNKIFLLAKDRE
jgi:hypothetical protein